MHQCWRQSVREGVCTCQLPVTCDPGREGPPKWTRASCAGLVLPVLGALPDALIIIVSGLGGSREEVAQQVPVLPLLCTPTRILTRPGTKLL